MIRINHNLDEVVERLTRLQSKAHVAMIKALDPRPWLPIAKREAEDVLMVLAETPEERELVDKFVDTVATTALGPSGMRWTMRDISRSLVDIQSAVQAEHIGGLLQFANIDNARRVGELIEEWVKTDEANGGKKRDERDDGATDEDLVKRLIYILFVSSSEIGDRARQKLIPHLQEFANKQAESGRVLGDEKVRRWFLAVLAVWRSRLLKELPERFCEEIGKLWIGTRD